MQKPVECSRDAKGIGSIPVERLGDLHSLGAPLNSHKPRLQKYGEEAMLKALRVMEMELTPNLTVQKKQNRRFFKTYSTKHVATQLGPDGLKKRCGVSIISVLTRIALIHMP